MKILVLGGSYFYGRVFTILAAKEHELTLFNRGTYPMEEFGVKQHIGDRHDGQAWESLKAQNDQYDAVVDFCGYEPGDIKETFSHIPASVKQYIFISTVDVYMRRALENHNHDAYESRKDVVLKDETTPYETREIPGEAGSYIKGKVLLEQELKECCKERGIAYTILRPAILYGPYNYAPRESVWVQIMVQNHVLPVITDAPGRFQFVYVKDAAEAVMKCLFNKETYGQAYNLCSDEIVDYRIFADALKQAAASVEKDEVQEQQGVQALQYIDLTVSQAQEQGVPLPFPVFEQETELCDNTKSKEELGISYTSLGEGMKKTYKAFRGVFCKSTL